MSSRHVARQWAVQLLFQQDYNPEPCEEALTEFWTERRAAPAVRGFVEELVRGVREHQAQIDALLQKRAVNWTLARMAGVDRNIMRVAIFEMLYRPEIPAVVSINEALELAKSLGDTSSVRFVNGILDHVRKDLKRSVRETGDAAQEK